MNTIPRIEGWKCQGIRCFDGIFEKWIRCVSEIADAWKQKDVPWWYNERASLSVFAGAIWRAGGFCFEEYCDSKRDISRRTRRPGKPYPGRVDLRFSWHGHDFVGEAKATYHCFGLSDRQGRLSRLRSHLQRARHDIHKTAPSGARHLGILFARPAFKKRFEAEIDDKLGRWVELLAGLDTSAYAWVFPKCARYSMYSEDGYFCPGEAILIREVRK